MPVLRATDSHSLRRRERHGKTKCGPSLNGSTIAKGSSGSTNRETILSTTDKVGDEAGFSTATTKKENSSSAALLGNPVLAKTSGSRRCRVKAKRGSVAKKDSAIVNNKGTSSNGDTQKASSTAVLGTTVKKRKNELNGKLLTKAVPHKKMRTMFDTTTLNKKLDSLNISGDRSTKYESRESTHKITGGRYCGYEGILVGNDKKEGSDESMTKLVLLVKNARGWKMMLPIETSVPMTLVKPLVDNGAPGETSGITAKLVTSENPPETGNKEEVLVVTGKGGNNEEKLGVDAKGDPGIDGVHKELELVKKVEANEDEDGTLLIEKK